MELGEMLAAAPAHIQRVILIGSQCVLGISQCEPFALEWEDVDLEMAIIRVHTSHKNLNAPWREIPIRSSLLPLMAA